MVGVLKYRVGATLLIAVPVKINRRGAGENLPNSPVDKLLLLNKPFNICLGNLHFHAFILETYIAPLQTLQLRGVPSPVTAKEARLEGNVKFGRAGHKQGTQLNGEIMPCRWGYTYNRKGPSLHGS